METTSVNVLEIGVKAKSKNEMYRTLTIGDGLYLPPQKETSMEFISDICFRRKKGLRASDIVQFIVQDLNSEDYLPSNYVDYLPNRTWLCNLANSLDHQLFQEFTKSALNSRQQCIMEKRNLSIEIDHRVADILSSSQLVSVSKGRCHRLLRKALIRDEKDDKSSELKKLKDAAEFVPDLKHEIESLKKRLEDQENQLEDADNNKAILEKLYDLKVIDDNGDLIDYS